MPKNREEEKFVKLVEESQGIIHKVCRMYCDNRTHREDLFQEIVLQLWKAFPSFKGRSKFSSWMYKVALNVAIQDFRKEKKRKWLFLNSYEFEEPTRYTSKGHMDERIEMLYGAISRLDKVEKAIILLYLDEVPNQEIAGIMGITQNYVRVKMTRIRKTLSKIMNTD